MSEAEAIKARDAPVTKTSLLTDLDNIGVRKGMTLFVQSSLSSMGWVCGGPVAVIQALIEAVGPCGTISMPSMTGDLSDPANWNNPPVPESWWQVIRDNAPAYNKAYTQTRAMGIVAETFRTWPGTIRSDHPHTSITSLGPLAEHITAGQPLSMSLGSGSPIERMTDAGGCALLIGTERNTTLHLAEALAKFPKKPHKTGAPMMVGGTRQWVEFEELDYSDHFQDILSEFRKEGSCKEGIIGNAESLLFNQKEMVTFGIEWMESHLNTPINE